VASDPVTDPARKPRRAPLFSPEDRRNIRWFWDTYLRRSVPALILVLAMIVVQGLVYQQFLRLTESGLRTIFDNGSFRDILVVCGFVFLLFGVRGAISYAVPRISTWLAARAVRELRDDMVDRYLRQDLAFYDRTRSGDVLLRLVSQSQELANFVGQQTMNAGRDFATIVIVSAYLAWREPLLFSVTLILLPALVGIMHLVSARIKRVQAEAQNAIGAYMNTIDEMTSGMRTVKLSGQEGFERDRLAARTAEMSDLMVRLQAAQALVLPSIDLASAVVYVLVIGGGGYMVLAMDRGTDGAAIIAFLLGLILIFDPARHLVQFLARIQASLVILSSVRSVFDLQPTVTDRADATDSFDTAGDIRMDGVRFAYSADQPLFDSLDLTFPGGRTTAIVGATGSGKTTVLSLLARLYEVEDGRISIGGTDVRDIRIATLRGALSVVAQDVVIFDASLTENIRYVHPDATDAQVRAAAEAAEIADLIDARGDAPVGPKGSQLSGGQRQRIAIARAFLRDRPIVLLDEATSALDQQTEERVRRALDRLTAGRTTLIVAHKLASVTQADCIVLLDRGRVAEQGTHAELLARGGLYAAMYAAQKDGYA
jgi:ATP-binding cassette subfamily B protein/subfamily B ATP-binding cassette protein MsbA